MNKLNLKSTLAAAALTLSLLAPAVQAETRAQAQAPQGPSVGAIAAQGNAALRTIRADIKAAALRAMKPMLPAARTTKVSVPAAGSMPATAAAAK